MKLFVVIVKCLDRLSLHDEQFQSGSWLGSELHTDLTNF